jgi:hypothetical protein
MNLVQPNSSQSFLLGRKHLSLNYKSVASRPKNSPKGAVKKAIKDFSKEVQSAVLPEIGSALPNFSSIKVGKYRE